MTGPGTTRVLGMGPGAPPGPAALADASSSVAGPSLVFAVGGLQRANSPLWTAEVFEAEHNAWRLLPEMSTARGYLGVAHGGERGTSPSPSAAATAREHAAHGRGVQLRRERVARGGVHVPPAHLAEPPRAWANERSRWVDTTARSTWTSSRRSRRGTTRNRDRRRSWTTCTPLSAVGATMGLAACQGTLYAVGGFAAPHYLATVEAYDPRANQWWGCAPLAAPRRDLGMCAAVERETRWCALGGYDGNAYLGVVEGFDPRTNNWRALAPLRRPRQLLGLCAKGDSVFALGGFDGKETVRTGRGVRRARGQVEGGAADGHAEVRTRRVLRA